MRTKEYFLKMVAATLCEQPVPVCPKDIDLSQLCKLALKNSVPSFLYLAIKNGYVKVSDSTESSFKNVYMTHLVRDITQSEERDTIRKKFTEKNIDFMFLKGSHLKGLYPAPEFRYMVDMDILVHEKDIKKGYEILVNLGFTKHLDNGKDIIFTKKPCLTIELHKMLFPEDYFMHDYFTSVWNRTEKISSNEYKMSYNDLYVYTLAHLAEHYLEAGSCFRPMMDLFLLEKKVYEQLDFDYINDQFEQIGIDKFARKIRNLYHCMFSDSEYDDDLKTMENYIVLGAPVKNAEASAKAALTQKSKIASLFEIAFPNFTHMKTRYPILKKVPFLLPIFWVIRIFQNTFTKDKVLLKKREQLTSYDKQSTEIMREIFDKSGL